MQGFPSERVEDSPARVQALDAAMEEVRNHILKLPAETGEELIAWLPSMVELIRRQDTFDPKAGPFFSRGDIVHVEFGVNIGSELRGPHFAVVMESTRSAGVCVVVPLTSVKAGTKPKPFQVDLGPLLDNGKTSLALVNQIRSVSKLRIQPLDARFSVRRVPADKMNLIDDTIRLLTHRGQLANALLRVVDPIVQEEIRSRVAGRRPARSFANGNISNHGARHAN